MRNALERRWRSNASFQDLLEELGATFHQLRSAHDREVLLDLVGLARQLATFSSRKSLSLWHREELHLGLKGLIQFRILPLDRELGESLLRLYESAMASLSGCTPEEVAELTTTIKAAFEAAFDGQACQPQDEVAGQFQEDLFAEFEDVPDAHDRQVFGGEDAADDDGASPW